MALNPDPTPMGAYLPRASTEYFSTSRPPVLTAGDLDLRFIGRPRSWRPTNTHGYACHGVAGDLSWRWMGATNGFPQVWLSFNGTTETLYPSLKAIPNLAVINGIRIVRTNASGQLVYHTSRDEGVSWQTLDTVATPAGALHLSLADLKVGVATPGSNYYKGFLRSFDLRIDGNSVANLDLTRKWRKATKLDNHGNEWVKNGDPIAWQVDRSGLSRRVHEVDLQNMKGWSFSPIHCDGVGVSPTIKTVTCARVVIPRDDTITQICTRIEATGTGTIAGQFAIHDLFGNKLASTAWMTTGFSVGAKAYDLTAPLDVAEGVYIISFEFQGTTAPKIATRVSHIDVNAGGSATLGWAFFIADVGVATFSAGPPVVGGIPDLLAAAVENDVAYYVAVR